MSNETADLVRICEALPVEKRQEVADFARFLLAQSDDAAWERLLDDPKPRPRLDAFVRESAAEGDEPKQGTSVSVLRKQTETNTNRPVINLDLLSKPTSTNPPNAG